MIPVLSVVSYSVSSVSAFHFSATLFSAKTLTTKYVVKHTPHPSKRKFYSPTSLLMTQETATDQVELEPRPSLQSEELFEPFGKGIARDYKARLPLMGSDIKDGLNVQVSCDYR